MKVDCIFCQLLNNESEPFCYEDKVVFAVFDKEPYTPGHILAVSKTHYENINAVPISELNNIWSTVVTISKQLYKSPAIKGVNLYQNNIEESPSHINHLHFHVVPIITGNRLNITVKKSENLQENLTAQEMVTSHLKSFAREFKINEEITPESFRQWRILVDENLRKLNIPHMGRNSSVSDLDLLQWIKNINEGKDIAVICLINSKVIGGGHISRLSDRKSHVGKISCLVDREYQGQGIGEEIVTKLIEQSKINGIEKIEAEPAIVNNHAIQILVKQGFLVEGVRQKYIKQENGSYLDSLQMFKLLK